MGRDPFFPAPVPASQGSNESAPTYEEISSWLKNTKLEMLCVLEGIEGATSSSVQCRHSYTVDDIEFNAAFHQCVDHDPYYGKCTVDFDRFHDLVMTHENV